MPSLELAIHHAALAIDRRGKRFSHQCRIPIDALQRAKALLGGEAARLGESRTFHELHAFLAKTLKSVRGLGELYVYDSGLRIGAFLGLAPSHVYLHAGTRTGARALGLDLSQGFLRVSELPKPIQELQPHEIEDFLCIYKGRLRGEG